MNKTIVILATAFHPLKVIATERVSKFVRSFAKEGWNVIVITIDDKNIKPKFYDNSRDSFLCKYNIKVIRVPHKFKEFYYIYEVNKNFSTYLLKILSKILFFFGVDNSIGWNKQVEKQIETILKKEKIDLILASGSPFMMFHVPYKINKKYKIPYILDFRDLWYAQPHGNKNIFQKLLSKYLEKKFMDNAKLVTTVSEGCKTKLLENTKNSSIEVLYNLPDEEYIKELENIREKSFDYDIGIDKNYINLVYTGTLYEGRDLSSIAKALSYMKKEEQNNIRVHYFGNQGSIAIQNFKKYDIENLIINHGSVSKEESIIAMFQSDILLSIIHNNEKSIDDNIKGIITTKIFDYILIGKPTINIAPVDNETRVLIRKLNVKNINSFTANEVNNIIDYIRNIHHKSGLNILQNKFIDIWHIHFKEKIIKNLKG